MEDLDSAMDVVDAMEKRDRGNNPSDSEIGSVSSNRVPIGKVEHFFDKIGVAAIRLNGNLKVGDVIEVGSEEEAVRQKVTSMQINREEIESASTGDDVGIKMNHKVAAGSEVYRIEN